MAANPLIAGPVNVSTPFSGTFILEDCEMIASGIRNGDWIEGGLGAFALLADGIAAVVDPLGSLIAAGLGWLMEHMEPIKGWLNDLTGDAGEVLGFAGTWDNISVEMQGVADEVMRILGDLDEQAGEMIDAYRRFQRDAAGHIAAASTLASAMSAGMELASTIVKIVHDVTRDALSQVVGTAISAAATAALTLGFGTPWAISQVATRVASLSAKVSTAITKLLRAVRTLLPKLDDVARLFNNLQNSFNSVLRGGSRQADSLPGSTTPRPRGADDAPRTRDEMVQDRIDSGNWEDPGTRPSWADRVRSGQSYFGWDIMKSVFMRDNVTLGQAGRVAFLAPADDFAHVASHADLVRATGNADSVADALRDGQGMFGIDVPLRELDLRVPGFNDAKGNPNFVPGGNTAVKVPGGFLETGVREAVVTGGGRMPPGTILFELLPDGSREIVRVFQ